MYSTLSVSSLLVAFLVVAHAATNCVTVSQTKADQWVARHKRFTLWEVTLTANSKISDVSGVTLAFSETLYNYTSLMQRGSEYSITSAIPPHATYNFFYAVKGTAAATISITSCNTTLTLTPIPTSSKSTATPSRVSPTSEPKKPVQISTPPPTPAPTPLDPATAAHCDVAFVIDNYLIRAAKLSYSELVAKYSDYFADVQTFYRLNFNIDMRISHIYLESDSSFSDSFDASELLDEFRTAIVGNSFPGLPTSACIYHLLTGKDIEGIGGLTWVGTACVNNYFNLGLTVDMDGSEDAVSVVRRMTHEMGHSFGGNHWDYYADNPRYTCDSADGSHHQRILRGEPVRDAAPRSGAYKYLDDELFFSKCAMSTIFSSLPNFACMWDENTARVSGSVTIYTERRFKGDSAVIPARYGLARCYNIGYPFGGGIAGFSAQGQGVKGIRFFASADCVGEEFNFGTSARYLGDDVAYVPFSFLYILE